MAKVVLASGSPRRKELLEQVGVAFEILVANGEEIVLDSGDYVVSKASNFLLVHETDKISHILAILSAVLTALAIVIFSSYIYKKRKQQ